MEYVTEQIIERLQQEINRFGASQPERFGNGEDSSAPLLHTHAILQPQAKD
ncbi:hypothetical protein [Thermoleptolyngbya sp.]